jgi:glycosyltransferase involved in cell wall biosynthesis
VERTAPVRVVHVITGLGLGGAERTLQQVVTRMDPQRVRSSVVSLTSVGVIGRELQQTGVPVQALELARGPRSLLGVPRVARALSGLEPDLVQTWMYHADLMGWLALRRAPSTPVLWNVRGAAQQVRHMGVATSAVVRACALLSAGPEAVVVNSDAGRREHEQLGYRPRRWVLVPIGVDADRFRPSVEARLRTRAELGLKPTTLVVGTVGRRHPKKRLDWILRAASGLRRDQPDLGIVLIGEGLTPDETRLHEAARQLGVVDCVRWIGPVQDVSRWLPALDVFVSASASEGFPNAVAEAMSCEVPCVVTDAGDSRVIVGEAGVVVGTGDADGLTSGLKKLASVSGEARAEIGRTARQRIVTHFSLESMIEAYERLYQSFAARSRMQGSEL